MMADERKKQVSEKIWLHYYNQELYKRNVITEQERNKMALRIDARKSPTAKMKRDMVR